ncbi:MAG: ATP:cob(I)alamin adenosyltransferase [Candidatus Puniceispirillum sp. TMED52]|nr:ATP:cob(I)alamin adenosyltransferase [SAR116 cluster bacterium]OUU53031.1 MAG: ATP:cob(I)alamin adenosyltransferase [Candidatus Puniceispirillum sp. TMED52]HCP17723.1 cob(I)yrinic acid a,c-diamide adenosyltransferase [Alphaproteobacteria bacterium]
MVKLNKIYTRTGDKGETSLVNGHRVSKHSIRPTAFGTVDEVNSIIGICRLHTAPLADDSFDMMLARIQNDLFDLGADLATPFGEERPNEVLRVTDNQVIRLETEIDAMNGSLQPLNSFVLPGGQDAAAYIHLARAMTRRAERDMTRLSTEEPVGESAMQYINRLSDHLFVMARSINQQHDGDVLWKPAANA